MKKFETEVKHIKYEILKEIAMSTYANSLDKNWEKMPEAILQNGKLSFGCCKAREVEIIKAHMQMTKGGDVTNPNIIQVLPLACDKCPDGGHFVTSLCRGCTAHYCKEVCPKNTIVIGADHKATIIKANCIECGLCAKACPYNAIVNNVRPCQKACGVGAMLIGKDKIAVIDNSKCVTCGQCMHSCPFGAIEDKSSIIDVIKLITDAKNIKNKTYAIVAPSIASQFENVKLGQVITGIKMLGFTNVTEAALGADMVAFDESKELVEKGFLTSSCCPSFVDLVDKHYPSMASRVSHSLSPMAQIAKHLKETEPNCKTIFIGPCTSKKAEITKPEVKKYVDYVLTFNELQAMFGAKDIDLEKLEESKLDDASYYGRIFARCGGLKDAVIEALKEQGHEDFPLDPLVCDGMDNCKNALSRAKAGAITNNFIEGMTCKGGCVGGPCSLNHTARNAFDVNMYGKDSSKTSILDSISKAKK